MTQANSYPPIPSTSYYLEVLAKSSDTVVFVYELAAQKFSFLNPAFEKIWERTRKSIMHKPGVLVKTIHPEDRAHVMRQLHDLAEGALIADFEFRIQLRSGGERWLCLKPLMLEDEQVIIGRAEDITTSKQYNDYLKKYSEKKNAILNILSHDLAGPLALIQTMSQALASDLQSYENPQIHQLIKTIENTSKRGTSLIQEFMKQEFLESAQTHVIKRRVELVETVQKALEEYQQTEALTGKKFTFSTSTERIYLELDDTKFMQSINNLISNSLKFTPDGGEITVRLEDKESTVIVQVADTGIGIPARYQPTLFEKFSPARRTGIKGEPSTGLGMSIIKTIVDWHHGHIWFESQENKGTTFYIEIPKI